MGLSSSIRSCELNALERLNEYLAAGTFRRTRYMAKAQYAVI